MLAANAVKEPLLAIAAAFERATGHKVTTSWSGTEGIAKRIGGGEVADIVVVGSASLERLIRDDKLIADTRIGFAKVGVGVAVRAGLPKPGISSAEAVKKAVLDARSVPYSSGPSGQYIADLFKRLGIAEQVKDKLKLPRSNVLVVAIPPAYAKEPTAIKTTAIVIANNALLIRWFVGISFQPE